MSSMNGSYSALADESRASRIPIDSLLNPSNDSDYPSKSTRTSPQNYYDQDRLHPYNHSQYRHHSPQSTHQSPYSQPYQQHHHYTPQFHPTQYELNRPLSMDDPVVLGTGSASSSPGPYGQRDRFPSVSSTSSIMQEQRRRPPRPKYEEEEMYFIWYHRVDLRQEWRQVRESFNAQFPNRQRSGFQGIQCKYYRFIKEKKCPTLRDQKQRENLQRGRGGSRNSPGDDAPAYGVVKWTGVWFPWMKEPRPPHYQHPTSAKGS